MALAALPAHVAAQNGDLDELKVIYSNGRRPDDDEETGETPLHAAARACQLSSMEWLLNNTAMDPQTRAKNGETAAHLTAFEGWLEGLIALCDYDERRRVLMVTDQDLRGLTPLHVAIIRGHVNYVQWILENFAAERLHLNDKGSLAVHFAAASGNLPILRLMVDAAGPECVNQADDNDATPVYFAAQDGKLEAIKYLVTEGGADAKAKSADGMQPLHAATQNGHIEVVKWLLARLGRTTLLEAADDGATPVHFAAAAGHLEILQFFFVANAQNSSALARAMDHMQSTPAHDAVDYGHLECVKILLKNGADLFATDKENTSPYSLAMESEDSVMKEYVMDYIRLHHLTPPDPAQPSIPTSSSIYENVNHPVIPRTGGASAGGSDGGVRTLHTLSQEIEAAQQEVMHHKLTSALEAAASSGGQSIRNRPQRRPSFKELKLAVDHSPRKAGSAGGPPPPPAPAPTINVTADDSDEENFTATLAANEDDSPSAQAKLLSRSRDEPDGMEHGALQREVGSWFAAGSKQEKDSDDELSKPVRVASPRRFTHQRRSGNSWYSSDDTETNLPAMAAEQLLSGKQRRKPRRRNNMRNVPRYQYMPVYQPVLTPYGYMMAQTLMPVPVPYGQPRRGSVAKSPDHSSSRQSRKMSTPGSGGRRVLRKDSGRLPTTPNLLKGFSKSINSLASLDEEGETTVSKTRRRSIGEVGAASPASRGIRSRMSPRSQSHTSMGMYNSPTSPYGYGGYGAMYSPPMSPDGKKRPRKQSRSSFMQRLFHHDSSLPRTRSMSSVPSMSPYGRDPHDRAQSDMDGTMSTSALGETYERGSTIVALAVSTAVTAMSAMSAVPRKQLIPNLADGAQRAITQFGLGEPIDLDDMRNPSKRKLIEDEVAGRDLDPDSQDQLGANRRPASDLHANKSGVSRRLSSKGNRTSGTDVDGQGSRPRSNAWEYDFQMESQASQRWGHDENDKKGLAMGEGMAISSGSTPRNYSKEKEHEERRAKDAEERKRKREEVEHRRQEEQRRKDEERRKKEEEEQQRKEDRQRRRDEAQRKKEEEEERRREEIQQRKEEEEKQREGERQRRLEEEEERRRKKQEQEEERRREEDEKRRQKEEAERQRQEEREEKRRAEDEARRRQQEEEEARQEEERERKKREEEEKRQQREDAERRRQEERDAKKREEEEKKRQREEEIRRRKEEEEEKKRQREEDIKRRKEEEEQRRQEERERRRQEEEDKKRSREEEKKRKEEEKKERKKQEEEEKKRQKEEEKERKRKEQEEKRRAEEEEKKRKKEKGGLIRRLSKGSKKDLDQPATTAELEFKPISEEKKPVDDDDPFGLSELALALELAGEAEYWKEHLTFEETTEDPHAKPNYESKASVEASAAGAVVFDESALSDVLNQSSVSANQPSRGSLSRQAEPLQTKESILSTAAALADFGEELTAGFEPPPPPPGSAPSMAGVVPGVPTQIQPVTRERTRSRGQATSALRQMSINREQSSPKQAQQSKRATAGAAAALFATNSRPDLVRSSSRPGSAESNNSRTTAGAGDELAKVFQQRKKKVQTHYLNNTG